MFAKYDSVLMTALPDTISESFPEKMAIVDCETTGMNPVRQCITEIAVVLVDAGKISKTWSSLIYPKQPIPREIQQLTGISSAMVKDAPPFADVAEELITLLDGRVLVAHNVRFDHAFLKNEFKRAGVKYKTRQLCSVKVSRSLFPEHRRHNLGAIIDRFGIRVSARHRALDDAQAVYEFFRHTSALHSTEAIADTCKDLLRNATVPNKIPPQLINDLPNTPGVYYFYDEAGKLLYVGKSVNIRDRVKSHFQQDYRNAKDLKIAQQVTQVECKTTLSDFSAQLLENAEIKALAPIHNRRLTKIQRAYYLDINENKDGYLTVSVKPIQLKHAISTAGTGLFRSQSQAKNAIKNLTKEFTLCQQLTGLESKTGRPCFAYQLKQCLGACCGKEAAEDYNERLKLALKKHQLKVWPWSGPIVVEENPLDEESSANYFVINNWCLVEKTDSLDMAMELKEGIKTDRIQTNQAMLSNEGFDLDTYTILCRFLLQKGKYGKNLNVLAEKA